MKKILLLIGIIVTMGFLFSCENADNSVPSDEGALTNIEGEKFDEEASSAQKIENEIGLDYYLINDNEYAVGVGKAIFIDKITIPESYLGKKVTTIITNSDHIGGFYNCKYLKEIVLPNSITTIGSYSFYGCDNLTSIVIPDSVTNIGLGAFEDCSRLTSTTFGKNSVLTSIGDYAFHGCDKLTSIVIPDSVTNIGLGAFKNCSRLTSITFGKNSVLTSIGDYAFYGCNGLMSISVPDSVTNIGLAAFGDCKELTSIKIPFVGSNKEGTADTHFGYIFGSSSFSNNYSTIPSTLKTVAITAGTSIGFGAFYYCSNLTSIEILNSVTSIGEYAFHGCDNLTSIVIPDSVTNIGLGAFKNCSRLTSITFGKNSVLTSIGDYAFYGCSGLMSIAVPDSVTNIGLGAFKDCSRLTSIKIPFVGSTKGGTKDTHFGYIFGTSSYSNNSSGVPSTLKTVAITAGTSIVSCAFYNCSNLTSIEIANSVTSIEEYAFSLCTGLNKVYYKGTAVHWNEIEIDHVGNASLRSSTIYYYSENEPDGIGNYWHYVNGIVKEW